MNKIIIGEQEFFILEQPIKQLNKIFGISYHLSKLMEVRFELFSNEVLPNIYSFIFIKQLEKLFPVFLGFKPLYLYHLYFLEYACNYRTYRHLYNLPVRGQRTWGGGRSIRILKSSLYNYKLRKFNKFYKWSITTFLAEVTNLLWYQHWRHEWEISSRYQDHLPWYVRRKKKWISLTAMADRRVESFFKHPYKFKKKKHHRKKKKINKHVITTGFPFLFTKTMLKNIT